MFFHRYINARVSTIMGMRITRPSSISCGRTTANIGAAVTSTTGDGLNTFFYITLRWFRSLGGRSCLWRRTSLGFGGNRRKLSVEGSGTHRLQTAAKPQIPLLRKANMSIAPLRKSARVCILHFAHACIGVQPMVT